MFKCLLRSRCHQYKMNIRENILNRPKIIDFFSIYTEVESHYESWPHTSSHLNIYNLQVSLQSGVGGWRSNLSLWPAASLTRPHTITSLTSDNSRPQLRVHISQWHMGGQGGQGGDSLCPQCGHQAFQAEAIAVGKNVRWYKTKSNLMVQH